MTATRFTATTFAGFKVSETNRTYPLEIETVPTTLAEAVNAFKVCCFHKERLVIVERDTVEQTERQHLFAIKKKAPVWKHPPGELMPRRVEELFADPFCVVDLTTLARAREERAEEDRRAA